MYEPSIADPNTNNGNNDVNLDRTWSIVFVDEVLVDVSSGETDIDSSSDEDSSSDDDIWNIILFLDAHFGDIIGAWYDCSCIDGILIIWSWCIGVTNDEDIIELEIGWDGVWRGEENDRHAVMLYNSTNVVIIILFMLRGG